MFNVLFTTVGRRVQLIKMFKESYQKYKIAAKIIGTDFRPELAPAAYIVDVVYPVPLVRETGYIERLLQICAEENVKLLIPLYEPEFMLLDQQREKFNQIGTFILLSSKIVLETCQDKYLTHQFFEKQHIKTVQSWLPGQLPEQIALPLFVKPRSGMGSIGIAKIDTYQQLESIRQNVSGLLVQEYVAGMEYTLDILADFTGRVLSVVPRERLEVRAGEVIKSRTVKRDDLINQGKTIVEKLGAIGPITVQCIDTGEEIYWIEINPRFGGGVPLTIRAGVDYPYLLYRLCQGENVEPGIGCFQDGLLMLRYDEAVYLREKINS